MDSRRVCTHPKVPDIEIHLRNYNSEVVKGTIEIFEKGKRIQTTELPKVQNVESYIEGMFAGMAYEYNEMRDLIFRPAA